MSSAHAARGFCAQCGAPLFYDDVTGGRVNLTIGSLDHPAAFPPNEQVGVEARLPWFNSLPAIKDYGATGANGQEAWAAAIKASNRQHPDHETNMWPPAS